MSDELDPLALYHSDKPIIPALEKRLRQAIYETARKLYREQWAQSDEEDWCARKEVEPGTYKWLGDE